jgi:3-deoxy-D-manno-octulosonic-acid transferase
MRRVVVLYNILQWLGLIVVAPLLFVKSILTPRHRGRIGLRLGIGLARQLGPRRAGPCIWVHALSVGEVSSSRALVRALRESYPAATLILSATTRSGLIYARETLGETADAVIPFPYDFHWSVRRALTLVQPDLFLLVETDFWPNFLSQLASRHIPALLVNGRISAAAFRSYRRFRFLFTPLFNSFRLLSMQTEGDAEQMRQLGVAAQRVESLGNLKYAALPAPVSDQELRRRFAIPAAKRVWVAGSTHAGEETVLFAVFAKLIERFPDLFLILAPRDVARAGALLDEAHSLGLKAGLRSAPGLPGANLLLVDTLGELASLYALAEVAFVGGSLVPERGHNPLEPAALAKPVLFGPHMEDFAEIGRDLLACGAAAMVQDEATISARLSAWLADPEAGHKAGEQGRKLIAERQQGVVARYLATVERLLPKEKA